MSPDAIAGIRARLPEVAECVVDAVVEEVPSYAHAFDGSMGATIRRAVEMALAGFLSLASGGADGRTTPTAPAVDGSYQLGRGEARSGRSIAALLSAFRVGARVAWRQMSTPLVEAGAEPEALVDFAELVFAYIDELSAAAAAGHTDELTTAGQARQRLLERVVRHLVAGHGREVVLSAARTAGWQPPQSLTAVLLPEDRVRDAVAALPAGTLQSTDAVDGLEGLEGLEGIALVLVPDLHDERRAVLLRLAARHAATVGQATPWLDVRRSVDRAVRARRLGLGPDTDAHLPELVLSSDPVALEDLRRQVLAPLEGQRPATRERLLETLRAWLVHLGRRDDVARALVVHPQTVRYRMTRLRELYGDLLDDPRQVLCLTVALGLPGGGDAGEAESGQMDQCMPPSTLSTSPVT
ncbi:PucR family transcriptional regulator [Nocardioides humi]|uniref:Helix-turn-helix domain-containing protein n=1 Tax=Nocardioides humi TaxID=449461 RepID=A0ABN2BU65_9ACTN|nr:PucR family transcriptional regulator [Nocardioides humi]